MDLLWMGLGLGLAAGISPGPLLTLVISSSLERGFGAGFRVALAPLITDAPIILLSVLVLRALPETWLALMGIVGGSLVVTFGVRYLRYRERDTSQSRRQGGDTLDLVQGALVNILNPHPWIFWVTVQGPILLAGWRRNPAAGVAFVAAFYFAIVGSKVAIAWLVARGRHGLNNVWYRRTLAACGILLIGIGLFMIFQAAGRLV